MIPLLAHVSFRCTVPLMAECSGIVSQPGTLSYLELGWILTPDGQPLPVQDVDFKVNTVNDTVPSIILT
jgi:hypothetical protein